MEPRWLNLYINNADYDIGTENNSEISHDYQVIAQNSVRKNPLNQPRFIKHKVPFNDLKKKKSVTLTAIDSNQTFRSPPHISANNSLNMSG